MTATGYYGVPGSSKGSFTVHIVEDRGPICGWRPRRDMEFQWCAHGIRFEYLECKTCKKLARLRSWK